MSPTGRSTPRVGRALATVAAAALLAACGGPQPDIDATSGRPAPVKVAPVTQAPLETGLRAVGVLAPAEEVRLSFKTGGIVASLAVDQGDRVRAGQLLAVLAQQEVEAALQQARALADKAERDLERGKSLYSDEVATREQLEDLTTARDVAVANLRAAEFNARHSRIEAPGDGIVLRRLAEPDELVAAGQPVLVLGKLGGGWVVEAALADRDLVRVEVGDEARVTLDAYPGREFAATVSELASAADPATGTYQMKLALEPVTERLAQGLVAKVEMTPAAGAAVRVIPVQSLVEADGSAAVVYVVARRDDGDVAERVAVRIGRLVGDRVEILEGLDGDERIVTEGATYLRDGQPVRVLGSG